MPPALDRIVGIDRILFIPIRPVCGVSASAAARLTIAVRLGAQKGSPHDGNGTPCALSDRQRIDRTVFSASPAFNASIKRFDYGLPVLEGENRTGTDFDAEPAADARLAIQFQGADIANIGLHGMGRDKRFQVSGFRENLTTKYTKHTKIKRIRFFRIFGGSSSGETFNNTFHYAHVLGAVRKFHLGFLPHGISPIHDDSTSNPPTIHIPRATTSPAIWRGRLRRTSCRTPEREVNGVNNMISKVGSPHKSSSAGWHSGSFRNQGVIPVLIPGPGLVVRVFFPIADMLMAEQ